METKNILLDIGSSTVKVYKLLDNGALELLEAQTMTFKEGFDPENGISLDSKNKLFGFVKGVKDKNPGIRVKTFATAIFRKLSKSAKKKLVDEFFEATGLFFNIISQELENFYLETALTSKCNISEPVLLINIGGGSTELVVLKDKKVLERKNIDLGVGTINTNYANINETLSGTSLETIISEVESKLPELENKPKIAFYSGGELRYMQLAGYPLKQNTLFADKDHPNVITFEGLSSKNSEIYKSIELKTLESLMPENPKWMHGARGCSAIAQAICKKYEIETIIPSNSNLIDGVIRQEYRSVVLSGSFRKHLEFILKIRTELVSNNVLVLSPRFTEPKNPGETFVVFSGEEGQSPLSLERHHLDSIDNADALIVCDPEGYVGASALIEIGYANELGKRIIFAQKPEEFMLNTLPAEVGL